MSNVLYTLRDKSEIAHLGVQWTGDNLEEVRNALSWSGIGVGYQNVNQDGETLRIAQSIKRDPDPVLAKAHEMQKGDWFVWERKRNDFATVYSDDDLRTMFPFIESGDTEERKESIAVDRRCNARLISRLQHLMDAHPELPIEWITPSDNDGYGWMGGYQFSDVPYCISVETVARGWRHHVIIKGETEATRMDSPDDPDLEWYEAIVVRMQ